MAYTKNTWNSGDTITKEKLDKMEAGIETANKTANKSTLGLVKQSANVAKAAGPDNVTKAEFDALIDALVAAGIMASS